MEKDHVHLAARIRAAGFRATTPRLAVLAFLEHAKLPLPIKKISKGIGKKVDQVTVYRTVEAFAKAGLVRASDLAGERGYEYALGNDHHHIVCVECGKVEDFKEPSHAKLAERVLKNAHSFSKLIGHSFEFTGLCNHCITTT
jgi:Fe2+ or Zn2+ uptake regulation protein